jgi:hypothetical protein
VQHVLIAGAQTEVKALNREMLYACSRRIEGVSGVPETLQRTVEAETERAVVIGKNTGKAPTRAQVPLPALDKGKKKRKSMLGNKQTEVIKDEELLKVTEQGEPGPSYRPCENGEAEGDESKEPKLKKNKKNKKKKAKLSDDDNSQPGNSLATPPQEGPALFQSQSQPGESAAKKNVRFSLKRNLVMTIGQPPLPEDIRTPPTAKPRGPALKRVSTLADNSPPSRLMKSLNKSDNRSPIMTRSAMKAKKALNTSPLTSPKRSKEKTR